MNEPLIALIDVDKVYTTEDVETRALSSIALRVDAGEYVSIEGPSGCGKSSLLAIIGLLERPTRGTYLLAGRDVSRLSVEERSALRNERIGFVFQNFNLIGQETATIDAA